MVHLILVTLRPQLDIKLTGRACIDLYRVGMRGKLTWGCDGRNGFYRQGFQDSQVYTAENRTGVEVDGERVAFYPSKVAVGLRILSLRLRCFERRFSVGRSSNW